MAILRNLMLFSASLLFVLLISRCGKDDNKDKKDSPNTNLDASNIPSSWDGKTDWKDSQWEVSE